MGMSLLQLAQLSFALDERIDYLLGLGRAQVTCNLLRSAFTSHLRGRQSSIMLLLQLGAPRVGQRETFYDFA
jgi:hypothetical protein